jgi:DNA-binding winged helix-turn-helix (wHTH) protein
VSRRQLMQEVWGTTTVSHGALDTLVNTLRDKLEPHGLIATVRGVGYSLIENVGLQRLDVAKSGPSPGRKVGL